MKRFDIYARPHKALRAAMAETLVAVGRADPADDCEMREALARLSELLALCEAHAQLENDFVHRAIDERRAEASCAFAAEHVQQAGEIAALRELALHRDPRLYRQLAAFVADNLRHMEDEETRANALLSELFTDEEIEAIERRLVASKAPGEMMEALRWMLPAMHHGERVALLGGMRAAPAAVFEAALAVARSHLPARDVAKLEGALAQREPAMLES